MNFDNENKNNKKGKPLKSVLVALSLQMFCILWNFFLLIFKYTVSYAVCHMIKRLKRVDCWWLMGRIIIFQFSVIILLNIVALFALKHSHQIPSCFIIHLLLTAECWLLLAEMNATSDMMNDWCHCELWTHRHKMIKYHVISERLIIIICNSLSCWWWSVAPTSI